MTNAIARPFAAAGSLVTIVSGMIFARARSWGLLLSRTKFDYRSEVGDPATNSIVGAVVGWISRNFPEAPVRIIREDDPEGTPIRRSQTGAGAMLRLLERPNAFYSGVLQWMATIVDFVTDGNAYWLKVRNDSGRVVALWWIPQQMLEPRWPLDDPKVFIGWYEYTVDGVVYGIDPRNVVHFRNGIDPANTRKGRSPLKALFREIFTDEEAASFTASLLRNLGVPGVVIAPSNTVGGQHLDADAEAVKTKFMDKFGGDKRGEPLVFTAPTDVKVLSWSPQAMDLKALRRIPEERISAVLGVHPAVTGLGAGLDRSTFTNMGEANKGAYGQGVIPLQRLIAAELEVQLLPDFVGDGIDTLDVYFDASVTAAMAEAASDVWKRAQSAATVGLIMRSAFKRMVGLPVSADGSDDVYIRPNNYLVDPGGSTPPGSSPRRQLGSGDSAAAVATVTEVPVPLLEAGAVPEMIHCSTCDRQLGKATAPYGLWCKNCKREEVA